MLFSEIAWAMAEVLDALGELHDHAVRALQVRVRLAVRANEALLRSASVEAGHLRAALVTEYPAKAKISMHVGNRSYGSIICGVSSATA